MSKIAMTSNRFKSWGNAFGVRLKQSAKTKNTNMPITLRYSVSDNTYILHKGNETRKISYKNFIDKFNFNSHDYEEIWNYIEELENGRNRQTATQNPSDPDEATNNSPGGANQGITIQTTGYVTINPNSGQSGMIYGNKLSYLVAYQQNLQQYQYYQQNLQQYANQYYQQLPCYTINHNVVYVTPEALEDKTRLPGAPHRITDLQTETIVNGEITAWRRWRVANNRLWSMANMIVWSVDVPMTGVPADGYGIHVYKTREIAEADYHYGTEGSYIQAVGEVEIWGDIIEHENGYRAEYAKVKSIYLIGHTLEKQQDELRKHYKCEQ